MEIKTRKLFKELVRKLTMELLDEESLEEITIGGISVVSGTDIEVAGDGSFEITLIVPPLSSGARYITVHSENGIDTWSTLFYVVSD